MASKIYSPEHMLRTPISLVFCLSTIINIISANLIGKSNEWTNEWKNEWMNKKFTIALFYIPEFSEAEHFLKRLISSS